MSTVTTSEAESKTNAWSYFELSNSPVKTIRDELEAAVPAEWKRIDDAHISILPGFDITPANVDVALDCIALLGVGVVGDDVTINGIECFHELDANQPSFVVTLDVEMDLESIRDAQEQWVENYGGSLNFDPVDPHITLFKAGDGDDEHEPLSDDQRAELKAAIDDADVPETLTVESLKAETY